MSTEPHTIRQIRPDNLELMNATLNLFGGPSTGPAPTATPRANSPSQKTSEFGDKVVAVLKK